MTAVPEKRPAGSKGAERERDMAVEFLRLVNLSSGTRELVQAATTFFQEQSGCQAVGIRLQDGEDYPYYEARGFPKEFVLAENSLCSCDSGGQVERDVAGDPVIACMCGNVIRGRFDPSKPFFTENGSFWTNCTTQMLASSSEADRQGRTRNRCNGQGYESVALIGLHCGAERIGLLQLNDRRVGMFTPEVIALWERLAGYLAVALAQSRAEEELRESEGKLRSAFANAAIGFAVAKPDGHIVDANPAYCALTGYDIEELRTMTFPQLIDPDDVAENLKSVERMLAGQITDFVVENRYRRKGGQVVWVRKSVSLVRSAEGRAQWILALVEDITERKQADANQALLTGILQALNRGGNLHALVAETLRLVREATGFDAVGLRLRQGEDCPYFENNGFSQAFLREENFLCARGGDGAIVRDGEGRAVLECTCGLVLSGRTDPSMACFTEGGSFWTNTSPELLALPPEVDPRTNPRNRCIHMDYQSVGLFPVKAEGEIVGLFQLNDRRGGRFTPGLIAFYETLAQNIGLALQRATAEEALKSLNETLERRVAERTAEAEQRAEQLRGLAAELTQTEQRERQRLAAILHDHLQQLLVGAKFHVGILRGQLPAAGLRESLKEVDNLLDESLEASRSLTVDLSPPILQHGTMAQVLQWLGQWFGGKHGLSVGVQVEERAHPESFEVRVLLFQVVRELLLNVVKHAQVNRARVELRRTSQGQAEVIVSDAGAGFDPTRGHSGKSKGSGFGLLNIRERLNWLGGTFEIESAPGQGTRVTAIAPMQLKTTADVPVATAIAAGAEKTAQVGGQGSTGKVRVLLADDHAVMRDGLSALLGNQPDIEVVGKAADGRQAVELAVQLEPDVVIMDVNMPVLDGQEATRQILAQRPGIQVIGLSMFAEPDVAAAMKEAGAVCYLAKTSGPEALVGAIRGAAKKSG